MKWEMTNEKWEMGKTMKWEMMKEKNDDYDEKNWGLRWKNGVWDEKKGIGKLEKG